MFTFRNVLLTGVLAGALGLVGTVVQGQDYYTGNSTPAYAYVPTPAYAPAYQPQIAYVRQPSCVPPVTIYPPTPVWQPPVIYRPYEPGRFNDRFGGHDRDHDRDDRRLRGHDHR